MSTNVEPILTFVRRRLDESRGEWVEISRVSGVPYHTLTKIAQGATPNPRIETVQRLVEFFNGQLVVNAGAPSLPQQVQGVVPDA